MSSSWGRSILLSILATFALALPVSAVPPTTTHAFSVVDGGGARIFFLHRERYVPISLRNDGFVDWRPDERFKFSYHWYSPSGELVEEGFRTRLPGPVAPREEVTIEARLKNYPKPGVYRLQWDLVQEGVTWFSEKDRTPEPARWVVVLPPLELFMVLLLPCAAALAALLVTHRASRSKSRRLALAAAWGPLLWIGVSLFGKPFLLYAELPRRFIPDITWTNSCAVGLPLLLLLALPHRWRPGVAWLMGVASALLVWGQTLYLRFFGDVATSAAVLASRQTGEIRESIGFLSGPDDWWLIADLVLALPLVVLASRTTTATPRRRLPLVLLLVFTAPLLTGLFDLSDFTRGRNLRTLRDVRDFGLYGYQALDAAGLLGKAVLIRPPDDEALDRIVRWFRETAPTRAPAGPAAGRAAGLNLLAIQAESMQQFVLDFDVDGQPITPNLRRLARSGIAFTAVQDQTSRGRSSAGDYVVNTSILPIAESVAYQYADNAHRGLAHALAERGYTTLSAIPYKQHFWNRRRTHPAYGFGINRFVEDFEPGPMVGWGLNDRDFLAQMVPQLEQLEQPFFAWLTTLSVHHPYGKFPDDLKQLDMGELEGTSLGNYLHGMRLLDTAIGELFEALAENGLADRTVVALWGDHSSGLLREEEWVDYFDVANAGHLRFQFRRVPLLLWVPGADDLAGRIDTPAGQVDIAPTLLALLGGRPDREPFVGRNLLGVPGPGPVVHPQASWISDELLYLNPREDVNTVRCWDWRTSQPVPVEKCRVLNPAARRQIEISEDILQFDLQDEIRRRLAQ